MKRKIPFLPLLLGLVLAASSSQGGVTIGGGIHLRVGGRFLQAEVATTAPVIVYDNVYYQRTVETVATLAPVTRGVAQTSAVVVPANTSEILVNGVAYPIDPELMTRTIEIVTGTVQKTVYEPQTVETTVYVPTDATTVTGAVYFVPNMVKTAWVRIGGVMLVAGERHPRYVVCKPPTGVIVVNGVWRYRDGPKVVPLRSVPPRNRKAVVKPGHGPARVPPKNTRRKRGWW